MEQTAKKPPQAAHVLLSIQALRGIAVMAVVLIHIQLYYANKLRIDAIPQFNVGAASVDVFFVISGFIMVYASERLFGQAGAMRVYFLRRIARIVPMYWAATTILLIYIFVRYRDFSSVQGGAEADYVIASYLFYPYVRPDGWGAPLLGVGWTLNYEVFFYTLFGLLIFLRRNVIVGIIGVVFCALIAVRIFFPALPNPFAYWFNPLIIEFVFGMAIAVAYREGVRIPPRLQWPLVAIGIAILGLAWYQAHFFSPDSGLRLFFWGVPAVLIVGSFALAEKRVPANLFWRVTGFLGDASYSIYLVHTLTLGVPVMILGRFVSPHESPWLMALVILVGMMIPSILVYLYVEKPMIDYFAHKIEGPRAPPQATAVATASPAP